jgi:hypothetical protein
VSGSLRSLRWRAAVTIAGAAIVILYLVASGRGPGFTIQIDYTMVGPYLDSASVEIDDEVVGTLEPIGARRVRGFRVEEGEHRVRVVPLGCRSEGEWETVTLGPTRTRLAVLIADMDDDSCRVILR